MTRRNLLKTIVAACVAVPIGGKASKAASFYVTENMESSIDLRFRGPEPIYLGDAFSIEGVHHCSPRTGEPLRQLQVFVATSGSSDGRVTIHPQIITDGHYRNVSRAPKKGARLMDPWNSAEPLPVRHTK